MSSGGAAATLRAIVFPGGFNWPLWAGDEKGFFAAEGVRVALTPTPGSVFQMEKLAAGDFDIAFTTFDNVVAYDEGQGEAALARAPDFFAFMGGQSGAVRLVARPEIRSIGELRGRSLAVDAATTGYAFVLRRILRENGLGEGDYRLDAIGATAARAEALMQGKTDATILTSPLEIGPEAKGCNRLANAVEVIGPYQAVLGAARRTWAREHADELVRFIRAYVAALDWIADPAHRDDAVAIYRKHLPQTPDAAARKAWDALLGGGREGFQRKAKIDIDGARTVLALRSEYARPPKRLADPAKYIDESYYRQALGN